MKIVVGASRKSSGITIGSELIQLWQNTDYSHVYVRWYLDDQEREIVYQASRGSVHYQSLGNFTKDNTIVKEFVLEISCEQFKKMSQKCIDLAGQSYSMLELAQIFFNGIFNIKFADQPGYICSELIGELLIDLGYKFSKPSYLLTPRDIIETLQDNREVSAP
jgi:hypothetical protein